MKELLKYRHEFKYLLCETERVVLENRISMLMPRDKYTGDNRDYLIRSLYFDDYGNSCYYDIENGFNPRVKYRIRAYNCSRENIKLEIKQKDRDRNHKEKCYLSEELFWSLLNDSPNLHELELKDNLVFDKFIAKYMYLKPAVIVEYSRTPYVYEAGNVRVTFDRDIASSTDYEHFFDRNMTRRAVLPKGKCLLEVKFDEFIPDFLYQALSLENLQRTSFSKYYVCRKYHL